jgi:hypothetical protein
VCVLGGLDEVIDGSEQVVVDGVEKGNKFLSISSATYLAVSAGLIYSG